MPSRCQRCRIALVLAILALGLAPSGAWSVQSALRSAYPVDVTPCGFAVIWEGQPGAIPEISVFADKNGRTEVTPELRITVCPLGAGDPDLTGAYNLQMDMAALRARTASLGLMKIRVENCRPGRTYYFRIHCRASNGDRNTWPQKGFSAVTTAREHRFIPRGNQLMVDIDDQAGAIDTRGWLVMAVCCENGHHGVSALVGEGAGANRACLNLSNFFDHDGQHWSPAGPKEIVLEIRRAYGADPIRKKVVVDFDNQFSVAEVSSVNVTDLTGETLGLADLIRVLNFLARAPSRPFICDSSSIHDRDGDGNIDISEVIYMMQLLSNLR